MKYPSATPRANIKFVRGKAPIQSRLNARPPPAIRSAAHLQAHHQMHASMNVDDRLHVHVHGLQTNNNHHNVSHHHGNVSHHHHQQQHRSPVCQQNHGMVQSHPSSTSSHSSHIPKLPNSRLVLPSQIAREKKRAEIIKHHDDEMMNRITALQTMSKQPQIAPVPPSQLRRSKANIAPRLSHIVNSSPANPLLASTTHDITCSFPINRPIARTDGTSHRLESIVVTNVVNEADHHHHINMEGELIPNILIKEPECSSEDNSDHSDSGSSSTDSDSSDGDGDESENEQDGHQQ